MPELPEVHTTATMLNEMIVGQTVTDAWSGLDSPFPRFSNNAKSRTYFEAMKRELIGATITKVSRRAKNVLISFDTGATLLVHMKMTGHLLVGRYEYDTEFDTWRPLDDGPLKDPFNRFARMTFVLGDGRSLVLCDARKFAKVVLLRDNKAFEAEFENTGPEPLDDSFGADAFEKGLMRRPKSPIKSALMDQELVAGIGNIYSDEILWLTGIHPESPVGAIPTTKFSEMLSAAKKVLAEGIDFGGDSMSDYRNPRGEAGGFHHRHNVYRRTGEPCSKSGCTGTIVRKVIRGRSGHFCDFHQILYRSQMRP